MFPRTSVWIRHEGSEPFLADATVATIYNRGQLYERFPMAEDGDRCDWFAVDDDLAREIAGNLDPAAGESSRPFQFEWTATSADLYYRQRALVAGVKRGALDVLAVEEGVMDIVAEVLALAYRRRAATSMRRTVTTARRSELVAATRVELARTLHANESVHDIARRLGTSPFHLCRVFRECTGQTMHEYRTQLRVRHSLERLEDGGSDVPSLSAVACDLGFASHSHYVRTARRHFGTTPSAMRRALG
ncbi:MAG: AraC family transcriptional regulator [bacterium]